MKYLKNISIIGLLAIVFMWAVPVSYAASLGSATAGIGNSNFCTRFPTSSQTYQQNIDKAIANEQTWINNEAQKIQTNRQTADTNLKQHRAQWAQNRQNIYAKLNGKATSATQKQALTTFQNAIEAAVTTRESAVDAAIAAYRQGFDSLVSQHQSAVQQVLSTFQTAIQDAIQQASSACSAGTAPATVKQNFNTALKTARGQRTTATQQIDKIASQLKQLAETRNGAIQQAISAYQTSMQAAVAQLKSAFGETSTQSPVPTASPSAS